MSKDIVLVVADTLRSRNLPFYGYERDTAPFLNELAEENVLFEKAFATAPWTVPSHASMFTGEMPDVCGTNSESLSFTSKSIVEELSDEGYETIGISNNHLIDPLLGFDAGFDSFTSPRQEIYFEAEGLPAFQENYKKDRNDEYSSSKEKHLDFLKLSLEKFDVKSPLEAAKYQFRKMKDSDHKINKDSGAEKTNQLARKKMENAEGDFFLFVNYMEVHMPYILPDNFDSDFVEDRKKALELFEENVNGEKPFDVDLDDEILDATRNLYDASIQYLDSRIEELYRTVENQSDDFVFIFVGDHGEMLGEMQKWEHIWGIWEQSIRVPAIMAGPNVDPQKLDENFSLRKVYDLINGEDPEEVTEDKVFSQYRGGKGLAEALGEGEPEDESNLVYYRNKSDAVAEDQNLIIRHANFPNLKYDLSGDSSPEETDEAPISLEIRFGNLD